MFIWLLMLTQIRMLREESRDRRQVTCITAASAICYLAAAPGAITACTASGMRLGRLTADAHHLNVKRQRFPGYRMVQVHGQFFIIGMKPVKSSSQSLSSPLGPPKDKLLQVYEKHNICDIALTRRQRPIKTSDCSKKY